MSEPIFLRHYSCRKQIPNRGLTTWRIRLSDQPSSLPILCAYISTPPFTYNSFIYIKYNLNFNVCYVHKINGTYIFLILPVIDT